MKRLLLLILAAVMLVSMVACSNSIDENPYNAPEGKLTATNDVISYYFFYPSDDVWTIDRNDGMISITTKLTVSAHRASPAQTFNTIPKQ